MPRQPIIPQAAIDKALSRKPKLTEADVQRACTDLLIADGWRAIRTDPVSDRRKGKGFGEIGMPDYLYIRYLSGKDVSYEGCGGRATFPGDEVWWIEYKAPGKGPSKHQELWHTRERSRGALVWVVDDIDQFRRDYEASGLNRSIKVRGIALGERQ